MGKILKISFLGLISYFLLFGPSVTQAQFVERSVNKQSYKEIQKKHQATADSFDKVTGALMFLLAVLFIISSLGIIFGFIRLISAGGDEMYILNGRKMIIFSVSLMVGVVLSFLVINIIKYYIY